MIANFEIWIQHPSGIVTKHSAQNTLTDAALEWIAIRLAGEADTRTLDQDWDFVYNAVGAGDPPAIDPGDEKVTPTVTFVNGTITVTPRVVYADAVADISARTYALDVGTDRIRLAVVDGTNLIPRPAEVPAGRVINFRWTIGTALFVPENAVQLAWMNLANTTGIPALDTSASVGVSVLSILRGLSSAPTQLTAQPYRWDGDTAAPWTDEFGPYNLDVVGGTIQSGAATRQDKTLSWEFTGNNGVPASLPGEGANQFDRLVAVRWDAKVIVRFGIARNGATAIQDLPVTMTTEAT